MTMGRVDDAIASARNPGVILTCFGDVMRVPGGTGSLSEAKAAGADVRVVYSPLDALRIAQANLDRDVVFFAVGVETTAASTALTLMRAEQERVQNFFVYCNHVTIIPPIRALLESPDVRLDGFIGPGHVCTCWERGRFSSSPPTTASPSSSRDTSRSTCFSSSRCGFGSRRRSNQATRCPISGSRRAMRPTSRRISAPCADQPSRREPLRGHRRRACLMQRHGACSPN
jgi:hydrogenase/urease nickel incorporation metallochaperone HypA